MRVLIVAGSNRRLRSCPGIDSKARALMLRMAKTLPATWFVDLEDIGNVHGKPRIQPCNACVSTSMALCVWPCNCYEAESRKEPDLMWDRDLYARLELADAWAFIGPINWYGPSSSFKLMFDRLVCMNGGNPDEGLIKHKDPELAVRLEHSKEWEKLSKNHLEGRLAAFFCYGDGGGDELDDDGRPKILEHKEIFDPEHEPFEKDRDAYAPLVWQCRYGGIEVPDDLWEFHEFGRGRKYSENQAEHLVEEDKPVLDAFDAWTERFRDRVARHGRAPVPTFSAVTHKPRGHTLADLELSWRAFSPPPVSSPAKQQQLGLLEKGDVRPKNAARRPRPIWSGLILGLLLVAQATGKLLDVPGYVDALRAFDMTRAPRTFGVIFMIVELASGVALAWAAVRAPLHRAVGRAAAAGGMLIAIAYTWLDVTAFSRGLEIDNCTCFGAYLGQSLGAGILLQEAYVLLLSWSVARKMFRTVR